MTSGTATDFDLLVIGAGAGGSEAALRGAALGLRTALVERGAGPGGMIVPSESLGVNFLLRAAALRHQYARDAGCFGLPDQGAGFDWARLQRCKTESVAACGRDVTMRLAAAGVTVLSGHARLDGPGRVRIQGDAGPDLVTARRIILATGSRPAGLPGARIDGHRVITSEHLLACAEVPASMIVLGAGPVGVELAVLMQAFGCAVTLVAPGDQILPGFDAEIAVSVAGELRRGGMTIRTGTRAREIGVTADGVRCRLDDRTAGTRASAEAACLLAALVRRPATADLGLDTVDVVLDRRGHLQVDSAMQTPEPGLYAIGDIVPTPPWAHVARQEARVAVAHAAGRATPPVRYSRIPTCVFSDPEVAAVGLTEAAAREAGHLVRCGRFPTGPGTDPVGHDGHARLIKVVADAETGRVLGVHMTGPGVTELIAAATAALAFGADLTTWADVVHPHPTVSEGLGKALAAALAPAEPGGGHER